MPIKLIPLIFLLLWNLSDGSAQSTDNDIQNVYQQFSKAYEELEPALIAPLYAEEFYYLTPDPDEGIRRGRDDVLKNFTGTFKQAEERGSELKISFNIIKRERSGNIAYDVGYYKFEALPEKGEPFEAAGKFVTVLHKNDRGQWQFVVDAFSSAPVDSFEEAK